MKSSTLSRPQLCGMIDNTVLKPDATAEDIEKLCRETAENYLGSVMVNGSRVALCRDILQGTAVTIGSVVGFPLGQGTIEAKLLEAEIAFENGAGEIDYVMNIGAMKDQDFALIQREMRVMVEVCRAEGGVVKVILETSLLSEAEISVASKIASLERPDFIKTSTGFGGGGALVKDVRLMKQKGKGVRVKASGGIRSWETCAAMIDAGAERIGTSSGVQILREYDEAKKT